MCREICSFIFSLKAEIICLFCNQADQDSPKQILSNRQSIQPLYMIMKNIVSNKDQRGNCDICQSAPS